MPIPQPETDEELANPPSSAATEGMLYWDTPEWKERRQRALKFNEDLGMEPGWTEGLPPPQRARQDEVLETMRSRPDAADAILIFWVEAFEGATSDQVDEILDEFDIDPEVAAAVREALLGPGA